MSELDTFENNFIVFANAISNFENQLEKTEYKQEDVKLLVFQTKNKLKNLYQEVSQELDRVEQELVGAEQPELPRETKSLTIADLAKNFKKN